MLGDVTVTEPAGDGRMCDVVNETGIGMRMGALGARSRILSSESQGLEVALRTGSGFVRNPTPSNRRGLLTPYTGVTWADDRTPNTGRASSTSTGAG